MPDEPEAPDAKRSDSRPQLPRDKRGWEVAPAPDGRGTPPVQQPPAHRTRGFLWFVGGLLALNILFSVLFSGTSTQPRVTIPFYPYFIQQVEARKVSSITSKGAAVQGVFKTKEEYPAGSSTKTTLFTTGSLEPFSALVRCER